LSNAFIARADILQMAEKQGHAYMGNKPINDKHMEGNSYREINAYVEFIS
jgi:hypothetical protein